MYSQYPSDISVTLNPLFQYIGIIMQLHRTLNFTGTKTVRALIPLGKPNSDYTYSCNIYCYPNRKVDPVLFFIENFMGKIRTSEYGYKATTKGITYAITSHIYL